MLKASSITFLTRLSKYSHAWSGTQHDDHKPHKCIVAAAGQHRPDLVFGRLWRKTGRAEVIRFLPVGRRFGFDVERAIYLTVLHHLMVSGSDRHASRWRQSFRIPGAEQLTLV